MSGATTDDTFITSYDKSLQLHTFVACLLMVCDVQVVEGSSKANGAQLVGTQSGDVLVKLYDWTGWLSQWARRIPNIKQSHRFVFSAHHRGKLLLAPLG